MHLLNNEYAGELRLGASTTIAQYILPPILAKFTEKYPQIKVSLIDTNSRNVENAVSEHTIDLGMVEGVFRTPNLKYEAFLCDELVPVVRSSAFPADVEEITLDEFCKIPLVLRERGSGTLDAIVTQCENAFGKYREYQVISGMQRLHGNNLNCRFGEGVGRRNVPGD